MIEDCPLWQGPRVLCSTRGGQVLFYARDRRTVTVFSRAAKAIWDAFRVPVTARQALAGSTYPAEARRCVERMVERGILTATPEEIPAEEAGRRPSGKLADVYLHLTNRCNLKCLYCYNRNYRSEAGKAGELSTAEWLRVLEQLPALGAEGVVFTGGEPLLRRDCLELAQSARRLGLTATLLTNGTILPEMVADAFDDVIVSLDSCVAAEQEQVRPGGRFDRITAGIRRLAGTGRCRVRIRPVITRYNVRSLPAFPAFADSVLGCKHFMLALYTPGELNTDLLPDPEVYREALERFRSALADVGGASTIDRDELAESPAGCGAGASLLSIAPNGDVFPCQCLHFPAMVAGNVRLRPLAGIWRDAAAREPVKPFDACRQCWAGGLCHLRCEALYYAFGAGSEGFQRLLCPFSLLELEDSLWRQAAARHTSSSSGTLVAAAGQRRISDAMEALQDIAGGVTQGDGTAVRARHREFGLGELFQ